LPSNRYREFKHDLQDNNSFSSSQRGTLRTPIVPRLLKRKTDIVPPLLNNFFGANCLIAPLVHVAPAMPLREDLNLGITSSGQNVSDQENSYEDASL
jgi:hypothetical protein